MNGFLALIPGAGRGGRGRDGRTHTGQCHRGLVPAGTAPDPAGGRAPLRVLAPGAPVLAVCQDGRPWRVRTHTRPHAAPWRPMLAHGARGEDVGAGRAQGRARGAGRRGASTRQGRRPGTAQGAPRVVRQGAPGGRRGARGAGATHAQGRTRVPWRVLAHRVHAHRVWCWRRGAGTRVRQSRTRNDRPRRIPGAPRVVLAHGRPRPRHACGTR